MIPILSSCQQRFLKQNTTSPSPWPGDEDFCSFGRLSCLQGAKILDWILDQAEVTTMAPIDDADDATASEVTKVTAEPDN